MQLRHHRSDTVEALEVSRTCLTHGCDGGFVRNQRLERQRLLQGDSGQHDAEGVGDGQPHCSKNGAGLFLYVLVDACTNNSIGSRDSFLLTIELPCSPRMPSCSHSNGSSCIRSLPACNFRYLAKTSGLYLRWRPTFRQIRFPLSDSLTTKFRDTPKNFAA